MIFSSKKNLINGYLTTVKERESGIDVRECPLVRD